MTGSVGLTGIVGFGVGCTGLVGSVGFTGTVGVFVGGTGKDGAAGWDTGATGWGMVEGLMGYDILLLSCPSCVSVDLPSSGFSSDSEGILD